MRQTGTFLTLSTLLGFIVPAVQADIYKYVDPQGRVYYTDEPKHNRYVLLIRTKPINYKQSLSKLSENRQKYAPLIEAVAQKYHMDPRLLHAVIHVESAYNPTAISTAGAVGMMQLMPDTAKRYGVYDRHDPVQNIEGGTRYLKDLIQLFNDLRLAIAAYNAGENAVIKYRHTIPPYPETQRYVQEVLARYQKLG